MKKPSGILGALGISSKEQLLKYIDENYGKPDGPIRILKSADLRLDSEDRIYQKVVEFEHAIIDAANLRIRDSNKIIFTNCVFTGEVHITQHELEPPIEITFYRCVCLGEITVSGLQCTAQVAFDTVTAKELRIVSSIIRRLDFAACQLGSLTLEDAVVAEFDTYANHFDVFEVFHCKLEAVKFDHSQVPLRPSRRRFDLFRLLTFPEVQPEEVRDQRIASTMKFLLQYTNIHRDRGDLAQAKYLLSVASKKQIWAQTILRVLGAFIKPTRIVALALVAFLFYVFIFSLPCVSFIVCEFDAQQTATKQEMRSLHIGEAVYFSGVTFTTIGYGDIVPVGSARYLAITEGAVGVTLLSAFLVALTRKYVD